MLESEKADSRGATKPDALRQTPIVRKPGRSDWLSFLGRAIIAVLSGICVAFVTLPLIALLLQVPFDQLGAYLSKPIVINSLRLTLISTGTSLALMLIFGTPVAYALGRYQFRGKKLLETILELPLVLTPAVAGVALLFAFGRRTLIAGLLREVNVEIAFTRAAVVLAQFFVASPFYIKTARVGFQSVPKELMDSASVQG